MYNEDARTEVFNRPIQLPITGDGTTVTSIPQDINVSIDAKSLPSSADGLLKRFIIFAAFSMLMTNMFLFYIAILLALRLGDV